MSVRLLKCRYTCVIDRSWPGERARHLSVALSRIWEVSGRASAEATRAKQHNDSSLTATQFPRNILSRHVFSLSGHFRTATHIVSIMSIYGQRHFVRQRQQIKAIDSPPTAYTEHSGLGRRLRPAVVDTSARLQTGVTRLTAQQLGCHSD